MTRHQRRIVILLAVANALFLGALLVALASHTGNSSPLGLPTPVPTYQEPARLAPACRRQASQMLYAGAATGVAALRDQTLRFDLVHRVTQDRPAQYAPQHAWTAFDVALALGDAGCQGFQRTEIVIETQDGGEHYRIYVSAEIADLRAHHSGELSERALLDHVQYRVERLDEDPL